jgi:hypothetical protein
MTMSAMDELRNVAGFEQNGFWTNTFLGLVAGLLLTTTTMAQEETKTSDRTLRQQTVLGEAETEQSAVGPYGQPEWTARPHRFATTRHYVLPPGVAEVELWGIGVFDEGTGPAYEVQEEFLLGLPNRFQIDVYQVQARGANQDSFHHAESKFEVRWALDEWGEIPLNPTLYAEWETDPSADSDAVEYKLLLADDLAPNWYWAGNAVYEQSYSGSRETELAVTSGLNYTVQDKKWNVGLEGEIGRATEDGSRSDPTWEYLVGPSFQYRFTDASRLRFIPLAGLGPDSPDLEALLIFGTTLMGEDGPRSSTATAERK